MKDKILLSVYLSLLVLVSLVHSYEWLLGILSLLCITLFLLPLKKREKVKILKRSFFSVFFFGVLVSVPYTTVGLFIGDNRFDYLLMINTRTLDLTLLTFVFLEVMNPFKALDFSKNLSLLLVITSSYVLVYNKALKDFKDAFKSRSTGSRIRGEDFKHYLTRLVVYFFDKSKETSEDIYIAMKSRGFYYD
jgi:cobalt/nickel transport system permease protein